jgi:hypothetical protein
MDTVGVLQTKPIQYLTFTICLIVIVYYLSKKYGDLDLNPCENKKIEQPIK